MTQSFGAGLSHPPLDVAIVGAGAAGVGAARRLAASGLSFTLIEASARVGGRAWTSELSGLPLDLGCGWLHSAERNPWVGIAEAAAFTVDRAPAPWRKQYRNLGFGEAERTAARQAFADWSGRLEATPPASDCAADALEPGGAWNAYIAAISGFINGAGPDRLSVADYLAYDETASENNWRLPAGYGALVAASLPRPTDLWLSTPLDSLDLDGRGVTLGTPRGAFRARAALLTVSTAALAGNAIRLPAKLDDWRQAATRLPLGRNEKLFLEIVGDGAFEPDTHLIGDPRDVSTGTYHIRPMGRPVIEAFLGGEGARRLETEGSAAAFDYAINQLAALFGSGVRAALRPLAASNWGRMDRIGGAYSHALPGFATARSQLARPFEDRVFFAGEATHPFDFSTAHGAYASGVRAAEEAIAALGST